MWGVVHFITRGSSATRTFLKTGELLPEPAFAERVRVMRRHFDLMLEVFGEQRGCPMFRKVARGTPSGSAR